MDCPPCVGNPQPPITLSRQGWVTKWPLGEQLKGISLEHMQTMFNLIRSFLVSSNLARRGHDLQAYAHTCFHLYADGLANDGMIRWLKDSMSHTNPILMSALSPGMLQEEPAQTTN